MNYTRGMLSPAIKRNIKRQEVHLDRRCRKIWDFENPFGEKYLFARFCNGNGMRDTVIATLGYFDTGINQFRP
jgi:hypothetical protein